MNESSNLGFKNIIRNIRQSQLKKTSHIVLEACTESVESKLYIKGTKAKALQKG